jgi:hypothetical protein
MLSPAETDRIKKDLATLKEAYEGVTDSGIRKVNPTLDIGRREGAGRGSEETHLRARQRGDE